MFQKLKVELPQLRENTPQSEGYVRCAGCSGEFTKLWANGFCMDCSEKDTYTRNQRSRYVNAVKSKIGEKGYAEFTFKLFKQTEENAEAFKTCVDFDPDKDNLYLYGSCGSGKTHLAGTVWRNWIEKGFSGGFLKQTELSRSLRGKDAEEEFEILDKLSECQILVIDDLGVGRSTEFANQILYEILDKRISNYRHGLILTSNFSLEDLATKVGDDRLPSRIAGLCKVIKLGGKDHRLE